MNSLRIGSAALDWQEFGSVAQLGVRTKAMPGGDGSLEFIVPGDFAHQHRNVLVPEARVILTVDGELDFGGRLTCDPLRHRLGPQDTVALVATGPWGMAGRNNRYSYLGVDPDLDRWQQYRGIDEHSGRFTVHREGILELRAETDRLYAGGDACRLYYWLNDGLGPKRFGPAGMDDLEGVNFEYKSHVTGTTYSFGMFIGADPAGTATGVGDWVWGPFTSVDPEASKAAWTAAQIAWVGLDDTACLMFRIKKDSGVAAAPDSDQWVKLRFENPVTPFHGGLMGRWADWGLTHLADILSDCADDLGIAAANIRVTGLETEVEEFLVPYPTNVAAVIAQATLLEAAPVEAYCDLAPDGSERFTANTRPTSVNAARNRLWSVGGRAGEDLSGLRRDWEATPEQVEVLYPCKGHATLPDGLLQAARYPASVTATYPLVETVDMTGEPPMTAALAAQYAQTIYAARQASLYAGDVKLGYQALTDSGQLVETVKLRPGDRLGVPSLLDVDANGLYVQGVSYDFRHETCTATIAEPWDPLGFRPRTAAAAVGAGAGGGGFKGGQTRKGGGYLRRSGVV